MPFSEFQAEPLPAVEAPHEAYLRWATDFGLIEWVVDEHGEVYYTTPDCGHECQHEDETFQQPVLVPAYSISKRKMSGRMVLTAGIATLATVGGLQMANAAEPEMRYEAANGTTIVVRGSHEVLPARAVAVAGPAEAAPMYPFLSAQIVAQLAAEKVPVVAAVEYVDYRPSKKGKTPLKTSKRTSTNKNVPLVKLPNEKAASPKAADPMPAPAEAAPAPDPVQAVDPVLPETAVGPAVEPTSEPATPAIATV